MAWYPFDTQKCHMIFFVANAFTAIEPGILLYMGPTELTHYNVIGVNMCPKVMGELSGKLWRGLQVTITLCRPLYGQCAHNLPSHHSPHQPRLEGLSEGASRHGYDGLPHRQLGQASL